jgi:hypothetical protein
MKRRAFITLLGVAAAGWPLSARAQQAGKLPTIGYLDMSSRSTGALATAVFVQRLRELGWSDGRTVAIEFRWAEGRSERIAEIAAEFVRVKVDLIVTSGAAVPAVKQVTTVIPIVFAIAADPVGMGLGRVFGTTGRQRHRPFDSDARSGRQAARIAAPSRPYSPPGDDHRHRPHGIKGPVWGSTVSSPCLPYLIVFPTGSPWAPAM